MRLPHYRKRIQNDEVHKTQRPGGKSFKDAIWFQAVEGSGIVIAALSALVTTGIAWFGFSELAMEREDRANARVNRAWQLLAERGPGSIYALHTLIKEEVRISYTDFSHQSLQGLMANTNLDLKGSNFSRSDLTGSDFSNARLDDTNFTCTDISGVNFEGASLLGADFRGAFVSPEASPNGGVVFKWPTFTDTSGILVMNGEFPDGDSQVGPSLRGFLHRTMFSGNRDNWSPGTGYTFSRFPPACIFDLVKARGFEDEFTEQDLMSVYEQ